MIIKLKHRYTLSIDLSTLDTSIPDLLEAIRRGVRKHGEDLDVQSVWKVIIQKKMSYNEAFNCLCRIVNIVDSGK